MQQFSKDIIIIINNHVSPLVPIFTVYGVVNIKWTTDEQNCTKYRVNTKIILIQLIIINKFRDLALKSLLNQSAKLAQITSDINSDSQERYFFFEQIIW